MKLFSYNYHCS